MDKPSPKTLREATGISQSYASMIANEKRDPPRSLAIHIFRRTGWKPTVISDLTDAQIDVLEQVEPWSPTRQNGAAA